MMETKLNVKGEWLDITEDVRWKEKFGTPPPIKKRYVSPSQCRSFGFWLFHVWNFINRHGYREVGRRYLGWEKIRYYVVPKGSLRF